MNPPPSPLPPQGAGSPGEPSKKTNDLAGPASKTEAQGTEPGSSGPKAPDERVGRSDPGVKPGEASPKKGGGFLRFALKWLAIVVALTLLGLFLYRSAGTSTYRGTVQRVYEKQAEYRVEFAELDGNVHVVGNDEARFPYFKTNTADLHAKLNQLSRSGDIVDLKVWGFRHSWLSMFPNVVGVTHVQSASARQLARAEQIADAVISTLANRDALKKRDEDTRQAVVEAVLDAGDSLKKKEP